MSLHFQITPTLNLSCEGRTNLKKLMDGLPIHGCAIRELLKKEAIYHDGKGYVVKPEVIEAFNARWCL